MNYIMNEVEGAKLNCPECECSVVYTGPLRVGDRLCATCNHPLIGHDITTINDVVQADARSGGTTDASRESMPRFR